MKKLVLLGGGYGNMRVLQRLLPNILSHHIEVTLIDRVPYHSFKTEHYALAAGTISDLHVRTTFPEHDRLNKVYGEISNISLENKIVALADGRNIPYDDLIIGLGCVDNYHQVDGAEQCTLSLQSIIQTRHTYQELNSLPFGTTIAIKGVKTRQLSKTCELNGCQNPAKSMF